MRSQVVHLFVADRSCEIVQVSEHTNLGVAAGQRLLLLSGEDLFPGSQGVIVCDGPPTSNRSMLVTATHRDHTTTTIVEI